MIKYLFAKYTCMSYQLSMDTNVKTKKPFNGRPCYLTNTLKKESRRIIKKEVPVHE